MKVYAADNLRLWNLDPKFAPANSLTTAADLLYAIAALHQPISNPYDNEPDSLCGHDMYKWPCPTARLLQGEADRG